MKTYPLLQSQLGVFLQCMQHPEIMQYNLPSVVKLDENVDLDRLAGAVESLFAQRRELHISFLIDENGEPRQYVNEKMTFSVLRKQMSGKEFNEYAYGGGFVRPFDILGGECLFRCEIITTATECYLLSDIHHLVGDGMTFTPVITTIDMPKAYAGEPLAELPYGMLEAAEDEQKYIGSEDYNADKQYYAEKLAGLDFSSFSSASGDTIGKMIRESAFLPIERIDAWCKENGVAVNLLFQAAFSYVLSAFMREDTVVYYSVNHGRMDRRLRKAYGMFVHSVPMLSTIRSGMSVKDYMMSFRSELMSSIRHGSYPFNHLCRDLGMNPGISFNFCAIPDMAEYLLLDGRKYTAVQPDRGDISDDLGVLIFFNGDKYEIRSESSEAANDRKTMRIFVDAMASCIENMMLAPDADITSVALLSKEEESRVIATSKGKEMEYDASATVPAEFMARSSETPEAIAVSDGEGLYTYGELLNLSGALAVYLRKLGIGRKNATSPFVGVMTGYSRDFHVAAFGIQRAGGAYLPMDSSYPNDRLQYMLEDSGSRVLITTRAIYEEKTSDGDRFEAEHILYIEDFIKEVKLPKNAGTINFATPEGAAYMIYTSGSTGKPKGVVIQHKALNHFTTFIVKEWGLTAADRISCHASYSFDASVEDLFSVLTVGGSVWLVPGETRKDLGLMHEFILKNRTTGGNYSTQFGMLLLQQYPDLPVRYFNVGGEKMQSNPPYGGRLLNTYGPTEFTVDATYYELEKGREYKNIPIGRPLHNLWGFVLDKYGHLLPDGVAGELCLAGPQIAKGYWKREELTAERFVDCPYVEGKMYHTGDLVRYNEEGMLEYLGRIDSQVKLRGFRIELGEIETLIAGYEGIRMVSVQVKEVGGVQHLCAYYSADRRIDVESLKSYLGQQLTEYMVPTAYMQMDEMPLTPNGKVNTRALPEPEVRAEEKVSPETESEKKLYAAACELLGHDQFGVTTNLISVGMTSLSAMKYSVMLKQKFGIDLQTKTILADPVIRSLAADNAGSAALESRIASHPAQEFYPITENQRGVYIDWEMNRSALQYNMPEVLKLTKVDADTLRKAIESAVEAHSYMKTRFVTRDGDIMQQRRDGARVNVTLTELENEPDKAFFQSRVRPFDLLGDDLYRFEIYSTAEAVYLFKDAHHSIFDGLSDALFMNDVMAAAGGAGLEPEKITAFDCALEEKAFLGSDSCKEAESYFDSILQGRESTVYPHSREGVGKSGFGVVEFNVPSEGVDAFCRRSGVTANAFFATALMQILHRAAREEDVLISTIDSGRTDTAVMNSVGMFVKTLPLYSTLDAVKAASQNVADAVMQMHEQILKTTSLSAYPFTRMSERHHVRPEILYVYHGTLAEETLDGEGVEDVRLDLDTVKMPLTVTAYYIGDKYRVMLSYNPAIYSEKDMGILASAFSATSSSMLTASSVAGISLLDRAGRKQVEGFRFSAKGDAQYKLFYEAIEANAVKYPDREALVACDRTLTFAQLNVEANRVAHELMRRGVKKGDRIVLLLPRTSAVMACMFGVSKAGGAYIPCDPEYPADRINLIVNDSEAQYIITTKDHAADYDASKVILVDEIYATAKHRKGDDSNPALDVSPDDLAYLIYTSGSTGRPKGVMLRHKGIANYLCDHPSNVHIHGLIELGVKSFVCITTLSFDMSLKEFAGAMFNGITCILADEREVMDAGLLAALMKRTGAEAINGTCSRIQTYLELDEFREALRRCKVVWSGGEVYPMQLLEQLQKLGVHIFNTYGPTEITVSSNIADLTKAAKVTVGRPLYNYEEFIVDVFGNELPEGFVGELLIGGPGVAAGYNNLPEMTAERFITHRGIAVYRSGDLARWMSDGSVEILGRNDSQVKLRGFRIELGEIEGVASKYEGIRQVVADVKTIGAVQHLCLYYTSDGEIDEAALRAFLAESLTEYMVPGVYMRIDSVPLTPNGKTNRKALPMPVLVLDEIVEPADGRERLILGEVCALLGTTQIGVTTNLVAAGLSSIVAMRLSAILYQKQKMRILVKDILSNPTVREMASIVTMDSGKLFKAYEKHRFYPLSEAQRGMLVDCLMNPEALQYNIPCLLKYRSVDTERLKAAILAVGDAHPYLKARLQMQDSEYVQERRDEDALVVNETSLDFDPDRTFFQKQVKPFNVVGEKLYRFDIFHTPSFCYLLIDIHHLISDGSSNYILARELEKAYRGENLAAEEYTAFDRAIDEENIMKSERGSEAEQYFDNLVGGVEATVYPHSSSLDTDTIYGEIVETVESDGIAAFCRDNALSPGSFFLTVFHNVLHRVTREDNTLVYFISNGRSEVQLENFFGVFVKTMPAVASTFTGSMADAVRAMQEQMRGTIAHDYYPFTQLVERHGLKAEILYNYFVDLQTSVSLGEDSAMESVGLDWDMAKTPLSITITKDAEGNFQSSLEYDARIYNRADMQRLSKAYCTFAANCVKASSLESVEMVSAEDALRIVELSRGRKVEYDSAATVPGLIVAQALRTPDAVAVVDEEGSYTYAELNDLSGTMALRLRGLGIGEESASSPFACIMLGYSRDFVVAALAVERAGGAYVPLDYAYPNDRLQYMLEDSRSSVLITTHAIYDEKTSEGGRFEAGHILFMDDFLKDVKKARNASKVNFATPEGVAYMIYTSGSTGKPKGVMISHASKSCLINFLRTEWGITAASRISCHSSFSFDASVEDLYPVLTAGGTLYVVPQDARKDMALLYRHIVDNGITGGCYTTQLGTMLLQQYPDLPVEYLVVGGEKMQVNPPFKGRLINTYGPTEFTVDATFFELEKGREYKNIPIGRPLHNLWGFVLDKYGHLLPQGMEGELCMAGPQAAMGYWQREDLTAEKFVDCPYAEGKMYHTGDLVKYNEEGQIEYLGRIDSQVKLRGFRIELGEIETLIAGYEGVRMVSVQVREVGGVQHLCAYYNADRTIDKELLRNYLAGQLTDYMVPTAYMQMDEMPLTPNGKVNSRALPEPEVKAEEKVAPETESEKKLFDIACTLLGHDQFGVTTNLVSVGMTSLSAMRLSAMINDSLKKQMPVTEIMSRPTLRDMASFLDSAETSAAERTAHEKREFYPLTENQRGVYVDWDMNRDTTQYNIVGVQAVEGFSADLVKEALEKVVEAHPYIKTVMALHDGDVMQRRRDDAPVNVTVTELDCEPGKEFFQSRVRPFDLFNDDLYRLEVVKTPSKIMVFSDFHHIVFDGASSLAFSADFEKALRGEALESERYTAFDFALDEDEQKKSEKYNEARDYFDSVFTGCEVTVYPHSQIPDGKNVGSVSVSFESGEVAQYCHRNAVTESGYFLGVMLIALHRLARAEQVVATSINSGRDSVDMMNTFGMFVKTLPVALNVPEDASGVLVRDIISGVNSQFNKSVRNSVYPFTEMTSRYGLRPEIMFAYQPAGEFASEETGGEGDRLELDTVKVPVSIDVMAYSGGHYEFIVEYDGHLYNEADMKILADVMKFIACEEASRGFALGEMPLMDSYAQSRVIATSKGKEMEYDASATVPAEFMARSSETPEAIAVSDGEGLYTYGELLNLSGALAVHLRKLGIGRKNSTSPFVGIMTGYSRTFHVAALGIQRAGGAYLPMDSSYPNDRLQYMLEDSGSRVLITTREIYGEKAAEGDRFEAEHILYIEDFVREAKLPKNAGKVNHATPEGAAYMIYTSGSTGKPKGVVIQHKALNHFTTFIVKEWGLTAADRISCHASYSFDASVEDLFSVLTVGGSVWLVPGETRKDLGLMHEFILKNRTTGGNYSTQFGMMLLQQYPDLPVRYFNVGGEKMQSNPPYGGRLLNTYGPTEFTVDATYYELEKGREYKNIPIGRPLHNLWGFVLDKYGHLLPDGVAGELCLAGPQIAKGYWKREELTAERFVDCPYVEGKMYHTGDLVRYNEEGMLEYMGRIDSQVKLRGFRIELGEIETQIAGYEGIRMVSVQVKEVSGVQHLCAYYSADRTIDVESLKSYLGQQLTEYMVPTAYMQMEEMPLTPNGKVNTRALPEPEVRAEEKVSPETESEKKLYAAACELLGHDQFGVTTNLISVGMTSLSAMRLSAVVSRIFGSPVPTREIMSHPTLRSLALFIDGGSGSASLQIAKVHEKRELYPLTENQRGVYADWEMNREALQYNIPEVQVIKGHTVEELAEAVKTAVEAHSSLKMRLEMAEGDVMQRRRDDAPVAVKIQHTDRELDKAFFQSRVRPFDLFGDDLYRFEIYQSPSTLYLFTDVHHIVYDGASGIVMMNDILTLLDGGTVEAEKYTAFDRALDEAEMRGGEAYAKAQSYFDELFASYEVASYPASATPDSEKSGLRLAHASAQGAAISSFCQENGLTVNSFFMAIVTQALHRILREDSLAITSISNGRMTAEMQDIVGMFVQTLPVVTRASSGSVLDAVKEVQQQYVMTQDNSIFPYTECVQKYGVRAEIMYVYQGSAGIGVSSDAFGLSGDISLDLDTVKMPLMISVYPEGDGYSVELEYDASKYGAKDMQRLASAIVCMAEAAAKDASQSVAALPMLSAEETEALMAVGRGADLDFDRSDTLVDLLRRQAAATPDSVAVVFRDRQLTYRELDSLTDRIAVYLDTLGVKEEMAVGVMIDRSELLAVYPIAIMKAGAAYMPLDSHFPEDRLNYMCEDAGVSLILADDNLVEKAMPSFSGTVFSASQIDSLPKVTKKQVASLRKAGPDNMFVILYTSGSTGKPKGCMLEHHNIVNFCHWYVSEFNVTAEDRSMAYANYGFDAHMMDMYPALSVGASVYVIPSEMRMDMVALNDYMNANGISITFLTTQIGYMFATTMDNTSLRLMSVGGEKLLPVAKPRYRFYNGYGPTECTLFSTFYNITEEFYSSSIIGRPLAGYQLMVVDGNMNPVPMGVPGELVVLGAGVGRGYLNRPDMNAAKFVTVGGRKAYRTGDLVRWSEEGFIDYMGRMDNQVKLRGLRIELGEIESRILQFEGIHQVCVTVKEVSGTQHLCCYYTVSEGTADIDLDALKAFLGENLTEFMIPTAYLKMDVLPLTPNGKVDRRALPAPEISNTAEYVEPEGDAERKIAECFGKVLGIEGRIGALDSFYSLGGDSIKAIRLVSVLRQEGIVLQVAQVMQCKTVRAMAQAAATSGATVKIDQGAWSGKVNNTAITEYFFKLHLPDENHFLQSETIASREKMDMDALRRALDALVSHHDILRAVVVDNALSVREDGTDNLYRLVEYNFTALKSESAVEKAVKKAGTQLRTSFDIRTNGMMTVGVYHLAGYDILDMIIHHLAVDGVSWRIIGEDFQKAYMAAASGEEIRLPEKTHSYRDYSDALERFSESFAGLKEISKWVDTSIKLPAIPHSKADDFTRRFGAVRLTVDKETTGKLLHGAADAYHAGINDLLVAAVGRAYRSLTGNSDLSLQMEGHGREDFSEGLAIDRTVGWFTSIYPVLLRGLNGDMGHDIRSVKETLHNLPRNGFGYGPLLGIDIETAPLFGFNYLGEMDAESAAAEDAFFRPADIKPGEDISEADTFGPSFTLNGQASGGELTFEITYDTALYTPEFASSYAEAFKNELGAIVSHCLGLAEPEFTASDLGETVWSDDEFRGVWGEFEKRGERLQRIYPLTPMQQSILLAYLSDPATRAYRIYDAVKLGAAPSEEQIRQVLDRVAQEFEVLRTSIIIHDVGVYRQAVVERKLDLKYLDYTGMSEEEQIAAFKREIELDCSAPFDLQWDSLFHIILAKTGDNTSLMDISFHHIILDGWCMGLIINSLIRNLEEVLSGSVQAVAVGQRGRYESFVREIVGRNHYSSMLYWKNLLSGYTTKAVIPFDQDIRPEDKSSSCEEKLEVDVSTVKSVFNLCRNEGITPNSVVELAWGLLLQIYNNTEDAVFAKVVSGRSGTESDVSDVVGLFINSVPVRCQVTGATTVIEALRQMHSQAAETNRHDYCSLAEIQTESDAGSELFQSIIGFQNFPDSGEERSSGISIESLGGEEPSVNEISMQVWLNDDRMLLNIRYDAEKYRQTTVRRILKMLSCIIDGIAGNPQGRIDSIPLMDEKDAAMVLDASYGGDLVYDRSETYVDMILRQAAEQPDATALVDEAGTYTFAQLDNLSNAMARDLIGRGVKPGDYVCIMLGRCREFILSVLAVNKAGAGYVPVDKDYPEDRRNYMMEDSGAAVVIDGGYISSFLKTAGKAVDAAPVNLATADSPAYMIYTSGTTGKPKGVMISQRSVRSCAAWLIPAFGLKRGKRNAHQPSFSFDASTFDLFYPLAAGAEVHVLSDELRKDIDGMYRYVRENGITGMTASTAIGMEMLNTYDFPLEYIMLGGEKFLPVKKTSVKLFNGYGPTEFTCCSSYHIIDQDKDLDIPIGRAVPGSWSVICAAGGRPVPMGVPGELCLAGTQIARGYWQRDEMTAERFHEVSAGGRTLKIYHTGDLACYNNEGEIMYMGRIDQQVKLRGFRIELGEIENQAKQFEGIKQVVADVRGADTNRFLALYYTASCDIDKEALRRALAGSLTDYMVPDAYVQLDKIPMTPGGKVDRKALPEPVVDFHLEMEKPATKNEGIIFDIVREMLGHDRFGVTDDLTRLGMTSLTAIKVVAKANMSGMIIKLDDLLKAKTIRGLLALHSSLCWWASEPDGVKPVVVLVQGETCYSYLEPYITALSVHFAVLVFESMRSHFDYLFSDADGQEAVEMYYTHLDMKMMALDQPVAAFTGHCFGADLTYRLACRWQEENPGQHPAICMLDSFWVDNSRQIEKPEGVEIPEELYTLYRNETDVIENNMGMYDILNYNGAPAPYEGKLCLFRATQLSHLVGAMSDALHISEEEAMSKYNVSDEILMKLWQPQRSIDNEQLWRSYRPDIEVFPIESDHTGMLEAGFVQEYVDWIKENV